MEVNTLYMEITNQCNFNCRHCQNNSNLISTKRIDFSEYTSILEYFVNHGLKTINLSGGEPTIHPDFRLFIESTVAYDININILSNGYLIDRYEDLFKKYKNKVCVQISLDGYNSSTFYNIRNNYKFNTIINNIKMLRRIGIPVIIKSTLGRANYNDYKKFLDLADKLDCMLKFNYLNPVGRAESMKIDCIDFETIMDFDKKVTDKKERESLPHIDTFFPKNCSVIDGGEKLNVLKITSDGCIYPCIGFRDKSQSLGNIREINWDALNVKMAMLRKIIKQSIDKKNCDVCKYSETCNKKCLLTCEYIRKIENKRNATDIH